MLLSRIARRMSTIAQTETPIPTPVPKRTPFFTRKRVIIGATVVVAGYAIVANSDIDVSFKANFSFIPPKPLYRFPELDKSVVMCATPEGRNLLGRAQTRIIRAPESERVALISAIFEQCSSEDIEALKQSVCKTCIHIPNADILECMVENFGVDLNEEFYQSEIRLLNAHIRDDYDSHPDNRGYDYNHPDVMKAIVRVNNFLKE